MKPIKIKRESDSKISVLWDDNYQSIYTLKLLRDECPCASCKGETILFKTYEPTEPEFELPGKYDLKSIIPIGNYAVQMTWGDGHDTGIYSWNYLRQLNTSDDSENIGSI